MEIFKLQDVKYSINIIIVNHHCEKGLVTTPGLANTMFTVAARFNATGSYSEEGVRRTERQRQR